MNRKNTAVSKLMIFASTALMSHALSALEPAKAPLNKAPAAASVPSRKQWLQVTENTSAASIIASEYQQQLKTSINAAAESQLVKLLQSPATNETEQRIKQIKREQDEQIRSVESFAKTSRMLSFESADGSTWQFFRDAENASPSRLVKTQLPPLKKYHINAQVYCSENTATCQRLIETTRNMKPKAPSRSPENNTQYKEWLMIANAEPCDPNQTVKMNPPQYPLQDQRDGISGRVIVDFTYNRCGTVLDAWVFQSDASPHMERAAVKAVLAWRINPKIYETRGLLATPSTPSAPTVAGAANENSLPKGYGRVPLKFIVEE